MRVRLPNGKVINNVPEGTTKAELKAIAIKNGLLPEESPVEDTAQHDQESQEMLSFLAEQGWEVQDIQ
jgi:hypothetical protein